MKTARESAVNVKLNPNMKGVENTRGASPDIALGIIVADKIKEDDIKIRAR